MQQLLALDFSSRVLLAVFAGLLALGILAATKRACAFFAADLAVPSVFSGMATSAAVLSAAPFLGLAGTLFLLGSDGLAWLLGIGAGLVLMGVLIAPAFRASGALTVPEFLRLRYGGVVVPLLGALVVIALCFVLLTAQLAAIGEVASQILHVPSPVAIGGAAIVIALALAAGGIRAATWLSVVLLAAVLVAYLTPLGLLTLARHGNPVGPLAYGQTLQQLQSLEIDMISEGLADARSLKPHLRPFLQVDYANTLALIVCLIAGTAVLPHVLMRSAVTAGVRQTRMSMAWALLFTTAVLTAIPAYAALTKHQIYSFVAKGVPFAELPEVFAQDGVSVHGVPFRLYGAVIAALQEADAGVADVDRQIGEKSAAEYPAWKELKPQVKGALIDAAKGMNERSFAERFDVWRSKLLPLAATAAGNKSGKLTQSAVSIEARLATFVGFQLAGLSTAWIGVFAIGAILAALATSIATAWAVAQCIGRDIAGSTRGATLPVRIAVLFTLVAAAAVALSGVGDLPALAAWTFSIAAAGLFPALVLGIWWKRTTRGGAAAGMLAGLAVTLGYIGGSHFGPVTFYELTGRVSDAGPMAEKRLADLGSAAEKASTEGRYAAEAALLAYARGTPIKVGAANWWGIHNSAAAVFGLPLGFFLTILVSLLTRRPSDETLQFIQGIRRPSALSQAD